MRTLHDIPKEFNHPKISERFKNAARRFMCRNGVLRNDYRIKVGIRNNNVVRLGWVAIQETGVPTSYWENYDIDYWIREYQNDSGYVQFPEFDWDWVTLKENV